MTKSRTKKKSRSSPSASKDVKQSRSRKNDGKPKAKGRNLTDDSGTASAVNGIPTGDQASREFPDAVYLDR